MTVSQLEVDKRPLNSTESSASIVAPGLVEGT